MPLHAVRLLLRRVHRGQHGPVPGVVLLQRPERAVPARSVDHHHDVLADHPLALERRRVHPRSRRAVRWPITALPLAHRRLRHWGEGGFPVWPAGSRVVSTSPTWDWMTPAETWLCGGLAHRAPT